MTTASLSQEVKMLRSLAVSLVGIDSEGAYRPAFVRRVLKASQTSPTRRFSNKKAFLAELSDSHNA